MLSLNVAETRSMLSSTNPKHRTLNNVAEKLHLKIHGSETKYLGVHVDNSLNWKENSIKVSRAIGFSKHAKNILPFASLKTMCSSVVEPYFRHCCSVWGCCGTTDIDQLQKFQNRAARIVTNSSFEIVRELIDQDSRLVVYNFIR